ncbi:MAG: hypothetical protein COT89_00090 [Candidatus Colwellbacteria bacterium CG10_big_fil_rev_8_21_14_0_10_42_22]|uniref:Methyltransferase domain-containing protein n=1 Tax=Candidatus Colwellbacteria bacterium CG10_big_fil_rev_8_21_14_0_10_42_22 TaxID=1974540 RepID=A0A2H0VIV3_9BACT|nr:MAG: hypothetical protein COT89_00090 [Candidatus Colwellbacteria bacterium CG10_big_fil_rev_8_21_14_0_10_42_22]
MGKADEYWNEKLKDYSVKDWANKSTIFINQILEYFPSAGKVLELAAGLGRDSIHLARSGFDVICTDSSDFGLREAQRSVRKDNLPIKFQKVILPDLLPFKSDEFEVVYSHLGLHYFSKQDTRALFEDIRRILKANGTFAALFNSVDDPEIKESGFVQIEKDYYHEISTGLLKRYFSVESTKELIEGLFEPIILDHEGITYKDGESKLIRLVAKPSK